MKFEKAVCSENCVHLSIIFSCFLIKSQRNKYWWSLNLWYKVGCGLKLLHTIGLKMDENMFPWYNPSKFHMLLRVLFWFWFLLSFDVVGFFGGFFWKKWKKVLPLISNHIAVTLKIITICFFLNQNCHKKYTFLYTFLCRLTHRCRFHWLFSLLSQSWRVYVKDSSQFLDHRTGKLHTVTSFLLCLFWRSITAGAPGKWERNVTFPFRLGGMWHSIDGFCRIGAPEACPSFFLLKQECGFVNWLALIRPVQDPITARPQRI